MRDSPDTDPSADPRDATPDDPPESASAPLAIERFELIAHVWNPLARYVEWSLSSEGDVALAIDCERGDPSIRWAGEGQRAAVFVFGFFEGSACVARLEANDSGEFAARELSFVVEGPVDAPSLEGTRYDAGTLQEGWVLLGLNNQFDDQPLALALVDELGRYRWLHHVRGAPASDNEVATLPEGVLVGGTRNEIDPHIVGWDRALAPRGLHASRHPPSWRPNRRPGSRRQL